MLFADTVTPCQAPTPSDPNMRPDMYLQRSPSSSAGVFLFWTCCLSGGGTAGRMPERRNSGPDLGTQSGKIKSM